MEAAASGKKNSTHLHALGRMRDCVKLLPSAVTNIASDWTTVAGIPGLH